MTTRITPNREQGTGTGVPTGAMSTEPARVVASITAAVTAVIALLVAYGFNIDDTQTNAILGVVAVLAPLIAGLVIRNRVVSPASAAKVADYAAQTGDPVDPMQPETWR